ncbi:hypothetical protein TWF970_008177 [Orbilia oligospora]|uniref:CCHC-type domain-containing protein n=1 Tax=Orbilia oligospora TaxID=2813651 RepID=A0A7C8R4D6_ORBOL|nr:hypothetical protein TWF970_008177 [Orbilia oligospora]
MTNCNVVVAVGTRIASLRGASFCSPIRSFISPRRLSPVVLHATNAGLLGILLKSAPLQRDSAITVTKQCYHCQGLGHVQADCPTLRINGGATSGRCYSCGQPGHLARNCPGNQRFQGGGFNGRNNMRGYASAPRPATCYKCGGPNHYARDCQAQAMKCYACGKLGHISRDCTAPNGGPLNTAGKTCYRCGEAGHISRDCPQNATTSNDNAGTTATATTATTNATDATPTPVAPAQTT